MFFGSTGNFEYHERGKNGAASTVRVGSEERGAEWGKGRATEQFEHIRRIAARGGLVAAELREVLGIKPTPKPANRHGTAWDELREILLSRRYGENR